MLTQDKTLTPLQKLIQRFRTVAVLSFDAATGVVTERIYENGQVNPTPARDALRSTNDVDGRSYIDGHLAQERLCTDSTCILVVR
ncbi:MAG: hypothetical protein ABI835_20360 [Chloroflexota bacterium]